MEFHSPGDIWNGMEFLYRSWHLEWYGMEFLNLNFVWNGMELGKGKNAQS